MAPSRRKDPDKEVRLGIAATNVPEGEILEFIYPASVRIFCIQRKPENKDRVLEW